ncbi:MAG: nitrate reductase molybdenum cofactor assembly chaperone [Hyphomicrobiaceae bacterium]|nr:nitrate reductase molybdenum cofactor assembly chaperone [Hyphomicrobiaceae bacterium]
MANVLKIISALLSYPTQELLDAGQELQAALDAESTMAPRHKTLVRALIDDLASRDIYDAEERYVMLFDRTRSLSLHLFEHVHGESRDRGQAMVDLAQMYEAQGFDIDAQEMPDYLPMFLEYLSTQSVEEVHNLLGQTLHILTALRERLQKRQSVYANAFLVLEALASGQPDHEALAALRDIEEDDPDDLAALDAVWEEEAVTFGGNAGEGDCGPDRLQRQMRAARRAPQQELRGE